MNSKPLEINTATTSAELSKLAIHHTLADQSLANLMVFRGISIFKIELDGLLEIIHGFLDTVAETGHVDV